MIDFHTHILPGIDDGSRDIVQTKELLRQAHRQGIHQILATPHFYADRDSAGHFLRKRKESLEIVQKLTSKTMHGRQTSVVRASFCAVDKRYV